MKYAWVTTWFVLIGVGVFAQNEEDAFRFSNTQGVYSNRAMGMGGAYASLGADFTNGFQNPAGLAVFKRNNLEIGFTSWNTSSMDTYDGKQTSNSASKFGLNLMAFNSTIGKASGGWEPWVYAFAIGRPQTFCRTYSASASDSSFSLLDVYTDQLNTSGVANADVSSTFPFGAGLAWETYLINPISGGGYYRLPNDGQISKTLTTKDKGYVREAALSLARSYQQKILIGGSLVFRKLNFNRTIDYREEFKSNGQDVSYTYNQLIYDNNAPTAGLSLQFKGGIQISPNPYFRAGAYYHSKVNQSVRDQYTPSMQSSIGAASYTIEADKNIFDYRVMVPAVMGGGASVIFGNLGVVSLDYETTDFSKMVMSSITSGYDFHYENTVIAENYKRVHRVRAGAEMRIADVHRARVGFNFSTSPYTEMSGRTSNDALTTICAGYGYRRDLFYFDAACTYSMSKDAYFMYAPTSTSPNQVVNHGVGVMVSIGIRY